MTRIAYLFVSLVSLGLTLFACGHSGGGEPDANTSQLVSIVVNPADQELVIDGTEPATAAYSAMGTFEDGHTEDISDRVGFSLSDATLGSFLGRDFKSALTHGGRTKVLADFAGVRGEANLTLVMKQRYNDPGATNLPTDPQQPFGGPVDVGRTPDVVYPNNGVLLPPNLSLLEVHFLPGASNTLFEITFENALTDVKVYTRCVLPMNNGCIYTPDANVWRWIADTNRGGDPVTVRTRGTDDNGTGVGTSSDIALSFSFEDVKGGIYYWRASGGSSVMRYDFGNRTQTAAEQFVGPSKAGGKCVGCHAISRDGTKLVASAGGWDVEDALIVDVATANRTATPGKAAFASWSPDGSRYVGVFAFQGTPTHNLMMFDGTTGVQTGTIDVGATAALSTSHPDWSPDGKTIAYVRQGVAYEDGVNNQRFYTGSIHTVTDQGGGTFGNPTEILPAVSGKNRYYPSFSPDNKLLVFNESTCPTGATHIDCNADSDPTASVYVMAPQAGATPIALTNANAKGKMDTSTALTNSWPKWAPFEFQRTQTTGSRVMWMTFSSSRKFGLRNPPASGTAEAANGTLLWMVAVDPDQAANGLDPSYPAFVLPFQDLDSSNHIAQWTEEIIVLQ